MKDYNEMAESVFERRDKYNAKRRMAMNKFKKGMTGAVCCCLVALLGVGVFNGNQITTDDTPNIAQYFIMRNTAVDDIILNTLGAICGYWVYRLLRKMFPGFSRKFICNITQVAGN